MPRLYAECSCGNRNAYQHDEIEGLESLLDAERKDAVSEVREEIEREFEDHVDLNEMLGGDRPLWTLAAAIRRGDRAEAELQLDRIAAEMGTHAEEQVQQGRFSPLARRAA